MENNSRKDPVVDLIEKANYIAVMPSTKGGTDPFCAGAGLYTLLKEMGKKVSIIYPNNVPKIAENLIAGEEIYKSVTERDLLISVDYAGTPATKMNYEVEDEVLKFRLGPVTKDYDFNRIRYDLIGHDYDLIFTIGVRSFGDLGEVYTELKNSFRNGQVVNLDNDKSNTRFAKNNYVDASYDGLSLMMLNLIAKWGLKMGKDSAKALLTGIAFKNGTYKAESDTDIEQDKDQDYAGVSDHNKNNGEQRTSYRYDNGHENNRDNRDRRDQSGRNDRGRDYHNGNRNNG